MEIQQNLKEKPRESKNSLITPTKSQSKPRTLVCPLCCREFGTKSLIIHYPQCFSKQSKGKRTIQKSNHIPDNILFQIQNQTVWDDQQIIQFNKIATQLYRNNMMTKCWNCQRNFVEQAYEKHKKNCVLINGKLNQQPEKDKSNSSFLRPKVLMCYLCGRQFGTSSLVIHQPQCIQKFKNEQFLKPKIDQRQLPILPEEIESYDLAKVSTWNYEKFQQYNKLVSQFYNKKSLLECQYCKRTFFPESLVKHQKGCKPTPKLRRANTQVFQIQQISKSPSMLVCYICGRQFGTLSLEIHHPHCVKKWQNQQKKKQQSERRKLPERSEEMVQMLKQSNWSSHNISKFNQIASKIYKDLVLQKCNNCGRTFLPQSLLKHIKTCKTSEKKSFQKNFDQVSIQKVHSYKKAKSFNDRINLSSEKQKSLSKKEEQDQNQSNLMQSPNFLIKRLPSINESPRTPKSILKRQDSKKSNTGLTSSNNNRVLKESKSVLIGNPVQPCLQKNKSVLFQSSQFAYERKNSSSRKELHDIQRQQCVKCGRKFGIGKLEKHLLICKSTEKGLKRKDSRPIKSQNLIGGISIQIESKDIVI